MTLRQNRRLEAIHEQIYDSLLHGDPPAKVQGLMEEHFALLNDLGLAEGNMPICRWCNERPVRSKRRRPISHFCSVACAIADADSDIEMYCKACSDVVLGAKDLTYCPECRKKYGADRCFNSDCDRPLTGRHRFCSGKCAWVWDESDGSWCPNCRTWVFTEVDFNRCEKCECLVIHLPPSRRP
jgi:hypothetical protein